MASATTTQTVVDPGFLRRMASLTKEDLDAIFTLPATAMLVVTILSFMIPVLMIWPPVAIRISEALDQTHTKLGLVQKTKKERQQEEVVAGARKRANGNRGKQGVPTVEELVTYPVKSCRGVSVTKSKVLPTGLEYDRLYAFAQRKSKRRESPPPSDVVVVEKEEAGRGRDEDDGAWEVLTQRQCPRLATISVDLWVPDAAKIRRKVKLDEVAPTEDWLIVRFPHAPSGLFRWAAAWVAAKMGKGWRGVPEVEILLPVSLSDMAMYGYRTVDVKIWKDTVKALDVSRELPREQLGKYLGIDPLRLGVFRLGVGGEREVFRAAPRRDEVGYQPVVGFADAYPLHLLNLESVKDVAKKMEDDEQAKPLNPNRFRANIIISNAPAYSEESWKSFRLAQGTSSIDSQECTFHVSCRAARCKLPNVDQATGERRPDEKDTEAFLRCHRNVDSGCPENGCLGMMVTPVFADTSGEDAMVSYLQVGMEIVVGETGEHVYVKM